MCVHECMCLSISIYAYVHPCVCAHVVKCTSASPVAPCRTYVFSYCMCVCSVRYHTLHPNYIHERLERLGSSFELRLLLVLVDAVSVCVSH